MTEEENGFSVNDVRTALVALTRESEPVQIIHVSRDGTQIYHQYDAAIWFLNKINQPPSLHVALCSDKRGNSSRKFY